MRAGTAFGSSHTSGTPYRVVVPGAEIRMLVLAAEWRGCVGVDLESGAFVRASHPAGAELPAAFDVVEGEIAGPVEPPDAAQPEALELATAPQLVGRLTARRAERLLAPLRHPPQLPLLGLTGVAIPYWTLSGDRPSLALVELRSDPRLRWGEMGPECHFGWQGMAHDLPLVARNLVSRLERDGLFRPSRSEVESLLGYRPRRLLVMLTPPRDGYCHKAVGALLPGSR